MNIYVVTEGEYSDYSIVKCCATKERAVQLIEDLIKENWKKYAKDHWHVGYTNRLGTFEDFRESRMEGVEMTDPENHKSDEYRIEEYEILE